MPLKGSDRTLHPAQPHASHYRREPPGLQGAPSKAPFGNGMSSTSTTMREKRRSSQANRSAQPGTIRVLIVEEARSMREIRHQVPLPAHDAVLVAVPTDSPPPWLTRAHAFGQHVSRQHDNPVSPSGTGRRRAGTVRPYADRYRSQFPARARHNSAPIARRQACMRGRSSRARV